MEALKNASFLFCLSQEVDSRFHKQFDRQQQQHNPEDSEEPIREGSDPIKFVDLAD